MSELKTMINSHIKIQPSHQDLYIFMYGKFEQMQDECSLSFYQVSEGQKIILKNPHYTEEVSFTFILIIFRAKKKTQKSSKTKHNFSSGPRNFSTKLVFLKIRPW